MDSSGDDDENVGGDGLWLDDVAVEEFFASSLCIAFDVAVDIELASFLSSLELS